MPEIVLDGVKKRFETGWAIHDYTITIPHGACWAVIGPSGAGKSLLLRLICGSERPTKGRIMVGGKVLSAFQRWISPTRRSIGYMSQDSPLPENQTVLRIIRGGFAGRGFSSVERDKAVNEMQERLGISGLDKKMPFQISGGERQRVALCRALAPGHKLLLLDEPLTALDPHQRKDFLHLLWQLHKELNLTVLYVTHYLEEAQSLCDRAILVYEGKILQSGRWLDFRTKPSSPFVGQFLSTPHGYGGSFGALLRQG